MPIALTNQTLEFRLDEARAGWTVTAGGNGRPILVRAGTGVRWRQGHRPRSWQMTLAAPAAVTAETLQTPLGPAQAVTYRSQDPDSGITFVIEWALPNGSDGLLWRLRLEPREANGHLSAVDLLGGPGIDGSVGFGGAGGVEEPAAFVTGWQSFGFAGALGRTDRYPRTRLGRILVPSREPPGRRPPRGPGRFASEMFTVVGDRRRRLGLVVGVLSELEAFSSLDIDLRSSPVRLHLWSGGDDVPLAPDRPFATDWAYLQVVPIDDPDPLGPYLRAAGIVGRSRAMDVDSSPLSGWCSWYRWFSRVDEEGVRENLDWLRLRRARLPLDVFLLDDGYERQIGDWYPPWPRFPQGPTTLAREVKAAGMKPGLWMAPFIATPTSDAVRDHPDWILRDFGGNPVPVGLVGNSYPYALDSSHPDVLDHLSKLVNAAVDDWGFEVLKLDFLYAAALAGRRHDPAATRAQTFRRALSRLRSAAGDRWIVGCGCPLGPAIGLVDSMRVSPDVAPHWHPHVRGIQPILRGETTIPAARNSIRNAVNLAPLHRRWWINDPDCVLLRPEPSGWADAAPPPHSEGRAWKDTWAWLRRRTRRLGLIDDEVKTLLTLNYLTGGSLIDSDHLPEFDAADETRLARLLPPLDGPGRAADWFDRPYPSAVVAPLHGAAGEWWLLALVNWSDRPRPMSASPASLRMPATALQGVDLWGEEYVRWPEGNLITPVLPPHAVYFTALRPISHTPGWLGDTFDLSGGQAVAAQARAAGSLRIRLELPRRAAGRGWVWLPAPPLRIRADGMPVPWSEDGDGVYRMDLAWDHSSELVIEWPPESALGRLRP